jgi:hypothetical protein
MTLSCTYHGGHPDHPAPSAHAELTAEGLHLAVDVLVLERTGATMGLALPTTNSTRSRVLTIPGQEVAALDAEQTNAGFGFALGGLTDISDDFTAGFGGIARTEGQGTLALLLERDGRRQIVAFTGPTGAVMDFAYGYQTARVLAGERPLPRLMELDAVRAAERAARVQEDILAALRDLAVAR